MKIEERRAETNTAEEDFSFQHVFCTHQTPRHCIDQSVLLRTKFNSVLGPQNEYVPPRTDKCIYVYIYRYIWYLLINLHALLQRRIYRSSVLVLTFVAFAIGAPRQPRQQFAEPTIYIYNLKRHLWFGDYIVKVQWVCVCARKRTWDEHIWEQHTNLPRKKIGSL